MLKRKVVRDPISGLPKPGPSPKPGKSIPVVMRGPTSGSGLPKKPGGPAASKPVKSKKKKAAKVSKNDIGHLQQSSGAKKGQQQQGNLALGPAHVAPNLHQSASVLGHPYAVSESAAPYHTNIGHINQLQQQWVPALQDSDTKILNAPKKVQGGQICKFYSETGICRRFKSPCPKAHPNAKKAGEFCYVKP